MHLMRDVLDKQLVDREECELGRVDGIVVELRDGKPPRVVRLEVGAVVIARRIGKRMERWAEHWHKRLNVRRSGRFQIPWEQVLEHNVHHLKVDLAAEESVAFDWERWLRRNVVERIPSRKSDEEKG